jgi:hypothetical protein
MLTRVLMLCAVLTSLSIPTLALAAPSITSLSPTSGGAGASVTITGTNFGSSKSGSTVTFNGTAVTSITSWNSTTIKAIVPTGATTGNVVVTVGGTASNGKAFTVTAPSITSLSPTSGGAGASVTISGTGFGSSQSASRVTFNGTTATTITSWSATTIKAIVPTGATTGNVVVTVAGTASNGKPFTVTAPSISSLSPSSDAVGASVTINGSGFGSSQGTTSTVTFNGTTASPTSWAANKIIVAAPSGATTGNVIVTVAGVVSNGKTFTVKPTPSITNISPTFGAVGIGVTISGTNFGTSQGSSTVQFNGVVATPTAWNASRITVPVPSGATSGNVVVNTTGVNTNGINFNVLMLTSIAVTPGNGSLPLNSVQQYTATATYSDNSTQNLGANATWSSSDITIASISTVGVLTAVGQGQATIQATFGSVNGSTGLTVTPSSFIPVGSLNTPRDGHTATLLPSGKVLVVGGESCSSACTILASAELYDPASGTFSATGSMATARMDHTATLLQSGQVLIVGGDNFCCGGGVESLSSAELYDPSTGTFTSARRMNNDHFGHTATLLNDGTVLIAGGHYLLSGGGGGESLSELYNPTSGTFSYTTGQLVTPRTVHSATLLNDGTVLIAGGLDASGNAMSSSEIYDPATGAFTATGSLNTASYGHTATLLNSDKVLIAAGTCSSCATSSLSRTEQYDPVAKVFALTGSLTLDREGHAAALLQNGTAMIVGGQGLAGTTGTAELFDPAGQTFTGSGSLNRPRWGHTATLLNDGTVLIAGGTNVHEEAGGELYVGTGPTYATPSSVRITPTGVTMLIGGTQQFTAVDSLGHPRTDATWTVDNASLATITTSSSPTLTAIAAGQITLTATVEGISAQTQVTISSATSLAPGTVLWSAPATGGFSPLQLAQAVPVDGAPALYSTQLSSDGTQTIIRALTADGQQRWQTSLPALNNNSIPDAFGGLLVTEHQTCNQGQTDPMNIVDLDATTGEPLWQITAQPTTGGTGPLFCFPEAPQMAIREGDGAVVIAALGNTSGLPELVVVDGASGSATQISIPPSTYTNPDQSQVLGYSPIGAPIVGSDGSAYVEYEVRTIAYPPKVTSAILYLLQIAPNNSTSTIQLSSTANDENLFPGSIIPDGQGGVLATWTIDPSNPPVPSNPYQAAHVVSGAVATTYSLPFAPKTVTYGKYPTLILGENGTAFATDGTDTDNGPQFVAFDTTSGAEAWNYQASTQEALSLMTAVPGGGLVGKITSGSDTTVRFDSSGTATLDNPSGLSDLDYWTLGIFLGNSNIDQQMLQGQAIETSMGEWAFWKGSRAKNNGANLPQVVDYLPSYIETNHSDALTTGKFPCSTDQIIRNVVDHYSDACLPPSDATARVNQVYKTRERATVQAFRSDVITPLDALAFFGHSSLINDGSPQVFSVGINFYYPIAPSMNPGDTATWDHAYYLNDVVGSSTPELLNQECFPMDNTCGNGPNPVVNKLLPLEKDAQTVTNLSSVWQYPNDYVTVSNDPPPPHRDVLLANKLVQQVKIMFFAACDLKPPLAAPADVPVFLQLWDIHDAQFDFAETRQRAIIVPNGNQVYLEDAAGAWQTILSDMILQGKTVQQAVAHANSLDTLQQFVIYGNSSVKLR